MSRFPSLAALAALVLVPVLTLAADPVAKNVKEEEQPVRIGLLMRVQHLLLPGACVRMDLSAEQLDEQAKIEGEWRSKRRISLLKMAALSVQAFQAIEAPAEAKDAGVQKETEFDGAKFALAMIGGFFELRDLRDTYTTKALAALTPEQRKQYAALCWEQQRLLLDRRVDRREARQENRDTRQDNRQTRRDDDFQFTADQQEKLREILTPKQQKQLGLKDPLKAASGTEEKK